MTDGLDSVFCALELGDLVEAELDRGLALEQRHEHGELAALGLDLADRTGKARERTLLDRDGLADLEVDLGDDRAGLRGGALRSGATTKGGKAAPRIIPAEIDFEAGETITIKEGSFAGLPGSISEIKPESGKLTVLVSLFERETPVELSFDQVTKL